MPDPDSRLGERPANDSGQWGQRGKPPTPPAAWVVLGIIIAIALMAGGLWAYRSMEPAGAPKIIIQRQVKVETLRDGSGPTPTRDDVALINYKGTLKDGTIFDQAQKAPFPISEVVPGFGEALTQMSKGGKYKVFIPSELGYGDRAVGPIPANTDLTFEVELLDFRSRVEIEQQMKAMQGQAPRP